MMKRDSIMRKVLSMLLICAMALPLVTVCMAIEVPTERYESVRSNEAWCSNLSALRDVFSISDAATRSREVGFSVDYTYSIEDCTTESAVVHLSFTIQLDNQTYTISTSGSGDIRKLTTDIHLLDACLEKDIQLGHKAYLVNIGFIHILEREGARITIALAPKGETITQDNVILMNFGTPVLTENIQQYLPDLAEQGSDNVAGQIDMSEIMSLSNPITVQPAVYEGITSERPERTERFVGNNNYEAQTQKIAFDDNNACVIVSLQSYGDNAERIIQDQVGSTPVVIPRIESYEIKLEALSGAGYIANIEDIDVEDTSFSSDFLDAVEILLGDLGMYGSSAIAELITAAQNHRFTIEKYSNSFTISAESAVGLNCFDSAPLPITFQLSRGGTSTNATQLRATTNIRYKIAVSYIGGDALWYYLSANTATDTFYKNFW